MVIAFMSEWLGLIAKYLGGGQTPCLQSGTGVRWPQGFPKHVEGVLKDFLYTCVAP